MEIKCESYKSVKRRTVKDNEVSQVMLSQSFAGVCTLQCGASLQENKTMYFRRNHKIKFRKEIERERDGANGFKTFNDFCLTQ